MKLKIENPLLIFVLAILFISATASTSYAVLTMSEIQYLFEQEKGLSWENATAEEQKSFLDDIKGREEFQEGKYKGLSTSVKGGGEGEDSGSLIDDTEEVPFKVRASYEADTGIEWDYATEKEKERYLKNFERQEKREEREDVRYERDLDRKEERELREFERHKKQVERRAERREKEKERKLKEVRKKRERNKKELERAQKELERMRDRFERKHR